MGANNMANLPEMRQAQAVDNVHTNAFLYTTPGIEHKEGQNQVVGEDMGGYKEMQSADIVKTVDILNASSIIGLTPTRKSNHFFNDEPPKNIANVLISNVDKFPNMPTLTVYATELNASMPSPVALLILPPP